MDIIITNKKNTSSNASSQNQNESASGNTATAATKDSKVKQTATSVFAHQVLSSGSAIAKQTAKFAISQYGDMTGDYIGQRKIDHVISTVEGIISLGSSFTLGAMSGGWVGAIVGLGTTAVQMGFSAAQNRYDINKQIITSNAQSNYNAQRIGSILVDGNRG